MNTHSRRAAAIIDDLIIIALIGGSIFGTIQLRKIFSPAKPVAAITATDDAVKKAQSAAEAATAAAAAAEKARAEQSAASAAQSQAVAGYVAGAQIALSADPAPNLQSRVAKVMVDDAAKTGAPVDAATLRAMTQIVRDLLAQNATTSAALQQQEAETAQIRATLAQKNAALDSALKDNVTLATTAQTAAAAAKALSAKNLAWATDNETAWQRVRAALWLIALLTAAALLIAVRLRGVTKVKDDLVALGEHTLATVEKTAGPAARATVEEAQKIWKEGDMKLDAALAATKAKLRL